jgi:hypothetical protein
MTLNELHRVRFTAVCPEEETVYTLCRPLSWTRKMSTEVVPKLQRSELMGNGSRPPGLNPVANQSQINLVTHRELTTALELERAEVSTCSLKSETCSVPVVTVRGSDDRSRSVRECIHSSAVPRGETRR